MDSIKSVTGAAPAPAVNSPNVQITTDERENQVRAKALAKVTGMLQTETRKGNQPKDPRENNLFKKWNDGLKSPCAPAIDEFQRRRDRTGIKAIVAGYLQSEQFLNFIAQNQKSSGAFTLEGASWGGLSVTKTASIGDVADLRNVLASQYEQTIVPLPERPLRVVDLLEQQEVEGGAVHFIRETGYTMNVDAVPENVDPSGATASSQSTITYDQVTRNIKVLIHHMKLPLQLLDDVPSLGAELERRMDSGLADEQDAQLLLGDATGANFNGLLTDGGIQTLLWSAGDPGDNMADAVLNSIVLGWLALLPPDGHVMNPSRMAKIFKMKDDLGRYQIPEAHRSAVQPTLWGLPVALTTAMATTTSLTGSFRGGAATYYDRMLSSIYISRENEDDLLKNIVTLVNMLRGNLGVKRPEAFVKLTFDGPPA